MNNRMAADDLEIAYKLWNDDSDEDVRARAFVEAWHSVGSQQAVFKLKWNNILLNERAIAETRSMPPVDYRLGSGQPYKWVEVEICRHELTDSAISALRLWREKVQKTCESKGIKPPSDVWVDIWYIPYDGTSRHVSYSYPRGISNAIRDYRIEMINAMDKQKREEAIERNPAAKRLQKKIDTLKERLAELEGQLSSALSTRSTARKPLDPIENLDLSARVFNSLKRTGITTIGDVLEMIDRGPDEMLAIRNFGEKSLDEVVSKLQEKGYEVERALTGAFYLE